MLEIQTRDFGSRDIDLGLCVNVDTGQIGLQTFKQVHPETKKQPKMYAKYKQVKSTDEARDFLGVSMGTILRIKAGPLTPDDDPTEYVLRRSQERAPDTVEIMLQITRETVVESMKGIDPGRPFNEHIIRQLAPYTHFVHSVTFGAEFIAMIKITNHADIVYARPTVLEWEGSKVEKDFLELLRKFEETGSTFAIRYHEIGIPWPARSFDNLTDFEKWLKKVQKKPIDKGCPLKFGVRSLQSIPELEDKLPVYKERAPVITQELVDFETEYDDLCESSDILKDCREKYEQQITSSIPFDGGLTIYERKVSELKQEYEDCLKQDLTRCRNADDQERLLQAARSKYAKMVGKDKNFTRAITSLIDIYLP